MNRRCERERVAPHVSLTLLLACNQLLNPLYLVKYSLSTSRWNKDGGFFLMGSRLGGFVVSRLFLSGKEMDLLLRGLIVQASDGVSCHYLKIENPRLKLED